MEQYFVIAKPIANSKNKYEDYRILKFDTDMPVEKQIPEGYEKKFGPASLDDCVKYLNDMSDKAPNWFGLTVAQYLLIGIVTISFVTVIIIGAIKVQGLQADQTLKLVTTADDAARILITFLVAVATVAIAFLAILTAMVIREYKERFALAKEVLTILVGILGTIVGFYFGAAKNTGGNTNANTNSNTTNTNGNTDNSNDNSNSGSNANNNANSNVSSHIFRLPSGRERYVDFVDDKNGKRKIIMKL